MSVVLVIGASSGIGLETARRALAAGFAVRAMARSKPPLKASSGALEIASGDALDSAAVAAALTGVDAVIQTLGLGSLGRLGTVTLFSQATRILIAAMQAQSIRRLVSVTGFGAGDSRRAMPWLQRVPFELALGRAYADKSEQERLIRESGLDWTIVRPGILIGDSRPRPTAVLDDPADWRAGVIARSAVADFLVDQIDDRRYLHKAPVLVEQ
ncbi:NAD(P)-dependent oxidoreductase [Bauldia litoralis]|uniref:NAD(P)-dependent oxidoreductase n=3 Tax=Bauldia litoralis TaxID=665467 RepID=UPI003264E6B1